MYSRVKEVLDLSASARAVAPSGPMQLPFLGGWGGGERVSTHADAFLRKRKRGQGEGDSTYEEGVERGRGKGFRHTKGLLRGKRGGVFTRRGGKWSTTLRRGLGEEAGARNSCFVQKRTLGWRRMTLRASVSCFVRSKRSHGGRARVCQGS